MSLCPSTTSGMGAAGPRCGDLDLFFDGELPQGDSDAFREHLGGCERCQRVLRGRMLEAVAATSPRREGAMPEAVVLPRRRARWIWPAAAVAVAAAAAVALWIRLPPRQAAEVPAGAADRQAVALAPERGVDVRFSAPALDGYRRRASAVRGASGELAPAPREEIGLEPLLALERRSELSALAGAYALKGNLQDAAAQAAKLPATAATLSDLAALELLEPAPQKARASAERALSLAAQARRREPGLEQAIWNQAVALERLRLTLAAAAAFDELAARGAGGWAAEARERAAALRGRYAEDVQKWGELQEAADRMAKGGPVMAHDLALRAPSVARKALHVAIAATADRARLGALAALAALPELGPDLARDLERVRAAGPAALARRAPLAGRLAAALGKPDLAELRAVRAQARAAGPAGPAKPSGAAGLPELEDIARAAALAIPDADVKLEDVAELERLATAGPWWRLAATERLTFYLTYRARGYAEAALAARDAVEACRAGGAAPDAYWCPRILRTVAAAHAEIGGVDRAYELIDEAQRLADRAGERREEGSVINALGQIAAARAADRIDPIAVSDAYLRESDLRLDTCQSRLYRLDFSARAALDHHRFADAARLLDEADQINAGTSCKEVRYNAELVRMRLVQHRPTAAGLGALAGRLRQIEEQFPDLNPEPRLYGQYMLARARLAVDGEPAAAALRDVVQRAAALPDHPYTRLARIGGSSALAEQAARTGAPERALAAIAARMGVVLEGGCAVGINHDDRVTVVVRGPDGRAEAAVREVSEGRRVLPPEELLPAAVRRRLAGCERIDVLATGPYFGVPRLLGPELRWAYRSSPRLGTEPLQLGHQVVVTDVQAPADLRLPPLRRMKLGAARTIEGAAATPDGVLRAIAGAQLAVINAHGVTDANEPSAASLVLSPDPAQKGSYWLTADRVRQAHLARSPVIILAACHAGRVQVSTEPWSLASSFLAAGARAVIAPATEIPDEDANPVFESIIERMQAGDSPEQAVAREREARGGRSPWLADVIVFQ